MRKKLIIAGSILFGIIILVSITAVKSKSTGAFSRGKAVEIKTVDAKIQDIQSTVSASGVVEESNGNEIYFDSPVKVNRLLVEKDQAVTKGQKLMELDLDDMLSQLEQAKISLNIQNNTLNRIKDAFKLQNTSQVSNSIELAKTSMDQAKRNLDRVETLFKSGAVSLAEYESAKAQYDSAALQFNSAQSNLTDLNNNNDVMKTGNERDIQNQEDQIRLTELKIQDLSSKIEKLRSQSQSPSDGAVAELNIREGGLTNPGMLAAKIINTGQLQVKLDVKEIDVLKVKVGQSVVITSDAFPDKSVNGFVKSVGATAKKKQGISASDEAYVDTIVSFDNSQHLLKPGMSVNAKIITEVKKNVIVIPFNTFQEDKDGNKWVFAVENGIAKQRNISIGVASELDVEVVTGLKGGEKLVEDPPSRLKDGMKVIVQGQNKK